MTSMKLYLGLVSLAWIAPSLYHVDALDRDEVSYIGRASPVSFIQTFSHVGFRPAAVDRHLLHKGGLRGCSEDPDIQQRLAKMLRSTVQDQLGEDGPFDTRTVQVVPKGPSRNGIGKILEVALGEPIKNETNKILARRHREGTQKDNEGQKAAARGGTKYAEQPFQEDVEDDRRRAEGTLKQHERENTRRHKEQRAARKGQNEAQQQEDREAHLQQKESQESQRRAEKDEKHRRKAEEEAQRETKRLKAAAAKKRRWDTQQLGQQGQEQQQQGKQHRREERQLLEHLQLVQFFDEAEHEGVQEEATRKAKQGAERTARDRTSRNAVEDAARSAEGEARRKAEVDAGREADAATRRGSGHQAGVKTSRKAVNETARKAEAEASGEIADKPQGSATEAAKLEVEEMIRQMGQAHICVRKWDLRQRMEESTKAVLRGLPQWPMNDATLSVPEVTLAFLIQASWLALMPVLKRTFHRLYSERDLFLYSVDRAMLPVEEVLAVLPSPLPENVEVTESGHADYFVWPRVEIVLDCLRSLLLHRRKWDFVIHLSESDYPLHSMAWIRQSLAMQRNTNFINVNPRCHSRWDSGLDWSQEQWYFWTQTDSVASCGNRTLATPVRGMPFPLEHLESVGFRFARGVEWMILTRELVKYALSPGLMHYRRLIAMHIGVDEMFWQTLALNIPEFRQSLSPQGWFIAWGRGKTTHSPDTLTEEYLGRILGRRQHYFFMRKVSGKDSSKLLDMVDNIIEKPDAAPGPIVADSPSRYWLHHNPSCNSTPQTVRGDEPAEFDLRYPADIRGTPEDPWQDANLRKQLIDAYIDF